MKTKFLIPLFFAAFATTVSAQTGKEDGSKFGHGEDSIRCVQNISMFERYGKESNWAEALPFWEITYAECPASRIRIYTYGTEIIKWQYKNATDAAKKKEFINKLIKLSDDRIKYFGSDKKNPADWIIGQRAIDYIDMTGNDADMNIAFGWLKQSVEAMQGDADPQMALIYFQLATKNTEDGKMTKDEYIQTYLNVAQYIDKYIADASGAMLDYAKTVSNDIGVLFANSGVADCQTLQNIYAGKIEQNKTDIEFLKKTITLLRKMRCNEIEAYFAASAYAHAIQPTSESAAGMARQAIKKENYEDAIKLFEEAANLSEDNNDKADYYYNIALLYTQRRSYANARKYALESAKYNTTNGAPYILIAKLYASDFGSTSSDPILQKAIFYAAVDKLEKAKQIDPSSAEEANELISSYRKHFPTNEEIFMHSDLEKGARYTVGGWVQETVVVR